MLSGHSLGAQAAGERCGLWLRPSLRHLNEEFPLRTLRLSAPLQTLTDICNCER